MRELMAHAKERGFRSMGNLVLSSNRDMLEFAASLGFAIEDIPLDPSRMRISKRL